MILSNESINDPLHIGKLEIHKNVVAFNPQLSHRELGYLHNLNQV